MEREILDKLIEWKNNKKKKPLIVYGARQVGKTYIINKFAKENYRYLYMINFEFEKDAKLLFSGNTDIKTLILQLTSYKPNIPLIEGKTLIFFDEVQTCPEVLTSLKSFSIDGRFDVICSGSMLGIVMNKVSSFPVGYVSSLTLRPMNFKEFLYANGYSDEFIELLYRSYKENTPLSNSIHSNLNKLFLNYMVVGGMPEAVKKFIETSNINEVLNIQRQIVSDYKNDIIKYAKNTSKEKIRECFESIPDQLAKDNKKFQYKLLSNGGTARKYEDSLSWMIDSGIGIKVNKLKSFDIPLKAYRDINIFKFYMHDTGLLLSMYKENMANEIINGNIGVFKGGLFENVIAQTLINNDLEIFYYQKSDNVEVDFITYLNGKILPIEVKSGKNTKSVSLKYVISKGYINEGVVLSMNNLDTSNSKIKYLPLYMSIFLKNE